MIRSIAEINSDINIVPIDYDPSSTRVNQENRIKLMLAIAKEKLENRIDIQEGRKEEEKPMANRA
jgi:predicted nucleotide-binding protein (sugar kinase/HSP70/actin superfamily)